jgi:hypothetical protein
MESTACFEKKESTPSAEEEKIDFTEILPTELMLEIISYIRPDKDLFSINQRFNAILGDTKNFMNHFEIVWKNIEGKNVEALLNSNRIYTSISISGVREIPADLISILQQNQIKSLFIEECQISSSEFQLIMEAVAKNVETISLAGSAITDDIPISEIIQPKFESLNWLETSYNVNLRFLKHFLAADKLNHINLENDIEFAEEDIDLVVQFLAIQKKLSALYLSSDLTAVFNKKKSIEAMHFQLITLHIEGMFFDEEESLHNFHTFLCNQNSRLMFFAPINMHLEFNTTRLILNEIKSLEKIFFVNTSFRSTHEYYEIMKNEKIQQISFNYTNDVECTNIKDVLEIMPNLKTIRLRGFPRVALTGILRTLKRRAPKLKTIQFFHCRIPSVEIKQVKNVEFHQCQKQKKFLKLNKQIKKCDVVDF